MFKTLTTVKIIRYKPYRPNQIKRSAVLLKNVNRNPSTLNIIHFNEVHRYFLVQLVVFHNEKFDPGFKVKKLTFTRQTDMVVFV